MFPIWSLRNILLKDDHIKISDIAYIKDETSSININRLYDHVKFMIYKYSSPEIFEEYEYFHRMYHNKFITKKTDIW